MAFYEMADQRVMHDVNRVEDGADHGEDWCASM